MYVISARKAAGGGRARRAVMIEEGDGETMVTRQGWMDKDNSIQKGYLK